MQQQPDGIETAMRVLLVLFRRCAEVSYPIPPDMPLDTPEHQRMAVHYLGNILYRFYRVFPESP